MNPRTEMNGAAAPGRVPPMQAVEPELPEIEIVRGQLPRMIRETLESLARHDKNIFQQAGEFVTIVRQPEREEINLCPGRASLDVYCGACATEIGENCARDIRIGSSVLLRPGTPIIRELGESLVERAAMVAKWIKWDPSAGEKIGKNKPEGAMVDADPDSKTLLLVGKRDDKYPIKPLRGIIETPALAPSGRVISAPGYDRETSFFMLPAFAMDPIPERPTREQGAAALRYLWTELYSDFPFADVGDPDPEDRDRAQHYEKARRAPGAFVGLASILTILARPAIDGACPGFIFEAPTPGSGKSLQMHITAMITTGRPAGVMTFPMKNGDPNEEELEKVLGGYAMGGARMIAFDNITGNLAGPALDKVLTAVKDIDLRPLGESKTVTMPWSAVSMFSGNNMTMSPDVARRTMVSRIVSSLECPSKRPASSFRHPRILSWIADNLPELVRAAFVVLRAYWAAGKPGCGERGSFEPWSGIIPGAIVYSGGPNVIDAWAEEEASGSGGDEISTAHGILMASWPFEEPSSAGAVLTWAFKDEFEIARGNMAPDGKEDARDAIRAICKCPTAVPKAVPFGIALGKLRQKIRDGRSLERSKNAKGNAVWSVKAVGRSAPRAPVVAPTVSPVATEQPATPSILTCEACAGEVGRGPGFCNPCTVCRGCCTVEWGTAGACNCQAEYD